MRPRKGLPDGQPTVWQARRVAIALAVMQATHGAYEQDAWHPRREI